MESLYQGIQKEAEIHFQSATDIAKWEVLSPYDQAALRSKIVRLFHDERTELFVAAALSLGKLAITDIEALPG